MKRPGAWNRPLSHSHLHLELVLRQRPSVWRTVLHGVSKFCYGVVYSVLMYWFCGHEGNTLTWIVFTSRPGDPMTSVWWIFAVLPVRFPSLPFQIHQPPYHSTSYNLSSWYRDSTRSDFLGTFLVLWGLKTTVAVSVKFGSKRQMSRFFFSKTFLTMGTNILTFLTLGENMYRSRQPSASH
jgi:hypothetical protein